jgi:hypothetical protein
MPTDTVDFMNNSPAGKATLDQLKLTTARLSGYLQQRPCPDKIYRWIFDWLCLAFSQKRFIHQTLSCSDCCKNAHRTRKYRKTLKNRIQIIKNTLCIPAAYAMAELAAAGDSHPLFFVRPDKFYESLVLFTALSSLLISLLLLIRDRDDPFRGWQNSYADIDLTMLFELEKELPIPSEKYQKRSSHHIRWQEKSRF